MLIYNPTFFKYVYDAWLESHGRYPSTGFLSLLFAIHICDDVSSSSQAQRFTFCVSVNWVDARMLNNVIIYSICQESEYKDITLFINTTTFYFISSVGHIIYIAVRSHCKWDSSVGEWCSWGLITSLCWFFTTGECVWLRSWPVWELAPLLGRKPFRRSVPSHGSSWWRLWVQCHHAAGGQTQNQNV